MTAGTAALPIGAGKRSESLRANHVIQGEQRVTSDPEAVLTTILGSCVAACLRDPVAKIGGMNHFLLPGALDDASGAKSERFGVHAMELLINELLTQGASRRRLQAKVFGGACLNRTLADVGGLNAAFAQQFLEREGITVVSECLRGHLGRRVQFWPVSGRARRIFLPATEPALRERPAATPALAGGGALELF